MACSPCQGELSYRNETKSEGVTARNQGSQEQGTLVEGQCGRLGKPVIGATYEKAIGVGLRKLFR